MNNTFLRSIAQPSFTSSFYLNLFVQLGILPFEFCSAKNELSSASESIQRVLMFWVETIMALGRDVCTKLCRRVLRTSVLHDEFFPYLQPTSPKTIQYDCNYSLMFCFCFQQICYSCTWLAPARLAFKLFAGQPFNSSCLQRIKLLLFLLGSALIRIRFGS